MFKGFFKFIVMLFLLAMCPQLFVLGIFVWVAFRIAR